MTQHLDPTTGKVDNIMTTGKTPHSSNIGLPAGVMQTQTIIAQNATPTRLTFDPPIKACTIEVTRGSAIASTDEAAVICYDAPTTAIAANWLDEALVAPRDKLKPDDGILSKYFDGATITYVDIKVVGTVLDLDITVVGIV